MHHSSVRSADTSRQETDRSSTHARGRHPLMDPSRQSTSKRRAPYLRTRIKQKESHLDDKTTCVPASSFMVHVPTKHAACNTSIFSSQFDQAWANSQSPPVCCMVLAHILDDGLEVLAVYISGRTKYTNVSNVVAKAISGTNPNKRHNHHP